MITPALAACSAFTGQTLWVSGNLADIVLALKRAETLSPAEVTVFDNATGRVVDLDLRGTEDEALARLVPEPPPHADPSRGRGRPKLGVVAREVTLLPRQWEWLSAQPGGASSTLRRLIEDARKHVTPQQRRKAAQEAAYRFMLAMAGDRPGYEEATRALFAGDRAALIRLTSGWPEDIRDHALKLAPDEG